MSSQERSRLERDMYLNPNDLLVGARANNLTHLEPNRPATLALDARTMETLEPTDALFACRSLEVAIFCAAVYSRDGWSGWHTYRDEDDTDELYEFFAAPHVLRRALRCMQNGGESSAYRVRSDRFKPYGPIPGQFIATEEVEVADEYRVSIMDMGQTIVQTAHLPRADQARPAYTRQGQPLVNLGRLLNSGREDAPCFGDLPPDQVAAELRRL